MSAATRSAGPTIADAISILSFVQSKPKGGRDWWVVPDLPNYSLECAMGVGLAHEFLRYTLASENGTNAGSSLHLIVEAMVGKGKFTGIEGQFLHTVGNAVCGRRGVAL